jgi:sulfofructose kinase
VLDQVFRVEHFPRPDVKTRATDFATVCGGNAANAAVAIARLGGRVGLASPLGDDSIGDRVLDYLAAEHVDCGACLRLSGVHSSISAIVVDARGERTIVNHRDDRLGEVRLGDAETLAAVATADVVLADNRFPEFALPICRAARERRCPVVLDFDQPTRQTDALLTVATHVVFSAEGLRATAGHDDFEAAFDRIARQTRAFLAVTDGANGMLCVVGALRRVPAFAVEAVDTLGAGDVFHGAFALALAEGRQEIDAMRFAAAAAAVKCMRFGGIAGAPTRREVDAFLASI